MIAHAVRHPTKHIHTYSGVYPRRSLNQQWVILSDNVPKMLNFYFLFFAALGSFYLFEEKDRQCLTQIWFCYEM